MVHRTEKNLFSRSNSCRSLASVPATDLWRRKMAVTRGIAVASNKILSDSSAAPRGGPLSQSNNPANPSPAPSVACLTRPT